MAKKKRKDNSDDFIKIEEKVKDTNKEEIIKEDEPIKKLDIPRGKIYKHPFVNFILVLTLLGSVIFFILGLFYDKSNSMDALISGLVLVIFTLLFVTFSMTTNRKNKTLVGLGSLFLLGYFVYGSLLTVGIISFSNNNVIDFTNMELTEVIKWSEKNKIDIIQDYEFSDMISEYHIISQNVKAGTKIKDIENITVAVSEGPNPSKEVVIPNMVSWDTERVLKFIKDNYLSNVDVEFVESSKEVNTVIEQNKSGNMKRDEELKLTFSYGGELSFEEVKLKDLTGMSKFEATIYLKQYHLKYEFEEVFSSKVKKGVVVKQSVKAGTMVKINDDKITISISKGPEIKIPNLKGMSMTEITEWVIKNKLKLEFTDKYDDSIDENSVIGANYKEGDIVAEGTVIEIVISRGKLIMPKFENYNDFREWAEKYEIKYEEQREFSDNVKAGEVIKYSYKVGDTIRNNDPVVVTVSNGKEASVPNVVGAIKDDATTKLRNAGFGYSFVYSYSSSVAKGKVIRQSISAGSKVAQGTTITVTISNGPKPASSSGGSSSGGSSTPTCTPVKVTIQSSLNGSSVSETSANYRRAYPNVKFSFVPKANAYGSTGMVHPDTTAKRILEGTTCDTFTIYIIQN